MLKGGFGNPIALPLQKKPRENGCTVFVDAELRPHANQWELLASIESMWDTPRVIGCAENAPRHIVLPRGCLDAAQDPLRANSIGRDVRQDRSAGRTVTAAALVVRRGVNTLVLVHRTELLKQWQERLQAFLCVGEGWVGTIGGGKAKPTGKIDVAVMMQSLSRQGEVDDLAESYGHVIVHECHHVGAVSFDAILKRCKAGFVLGLTATPIRRDGQQPIIFMQCEPIRHTSVRPLDAPLDLGLLPRSRFASIDLPPASGIQEVFRHLENDRSQPVAIAAEVGKALDRGRKVAVPTERTRHLEAIRVALAAEAPSPFVLRGRTSRKQRATPIEALDALPPDALRIVLASGKLVGEGFDHPPLDTVVLAMPVSWTGTLQQYAGRLRRDHANKASVRIIDFVNNGQPTLLRTWGTRQRGDRAMGYSIRADASVARVVEAERRIGGALSTGVRH